MGETTEVKKVEKKQDATLGRSAKVAIWTALIAAASTFFTTGVPDIIRLFSSRPPLEQVQDMIADQTDKLTIATNRNVETLRKQQDALRTLADLITRQREELARLQGRMEVTRDVVRDCCTRGARGVKKKLQERTEAVTGPPEPPPELMKFMVHDAKKEKTFERVPKMERPWQQIQKQE